MDAGDFNNVDPRIVRVTYTNLQTGSEVASHSTPGNITTVGNNNTPVLVGALVAGGVVVAAVLAFAYRRRAKGETGEGTATEFGEEPTASSP